MNQVNENPLVSVVAICHNHAAFVIETLESIINQTYPHIQLIIINNKKDECEQLIANWITANSIQCEFIQNEKILNISENCNLGLSHANGKYIQLISCDDVLIQDKIESQVALFKKHPNIAVVAGNTEEIDANGKFLYNIIAKIKEGEYYYFKEIFVNGFKINTPTALISTEKAKLVGGYNEKIEVEDFQMWLKLSERYPIYISKKIVVKRRFLPSSLSRNRNFLKLNRIKSLKLFKNSNLFEAAKKSFLSDYYYSKFLKGEISLFRLFKKSGFAIFTILNLKKIILKYYNK